MTACKCFNLFVCFEDKGQQITFVRNKKQIVNVFIEYIAFVPVTFQFLSVLIFNVSWQFVKFIYTDITSLTNKHCLKFTIGAALAWNKSTNLPVLMEKILSFPCN